MTCSGDRGILDEKTYHIKAHYRLSYADAFAVALAQKLDAVVVTGDPELKSVEELAHIEWLSQPNAVGG